MLARHVKVIISEVSVSYKIVLRIVLQTPWVYNMLQMQHFHQNCHPQSTGPCSSKYAKFSVHLCSPAILSHTKLYYQAQMLFIFLFVALGKIVQSDVIFTDFPGPDVPVSCMDCYMIRFILTYCITHASTEWKTDEWNRAHTWVICAIFCCVTRIWNLRDPRTEKIIV